MRTKKNILDSNMYLGMATFTSICLPDKHIIMSLCTGFRPTRINLSSLYLPELTTDKTHGLILPK